MRGILSTNLNLTGHQSIAGGVTITGASNWNELRNKPFETLSEDFTVENGALELASVPVAEVEWDSITAKPFSTIDYETGLTVYDNTLMIDTLDTIATIDYVNSQIPDTSDFVTAEALTPYVEASSLSPVAFSGSYNDLSNKPTIPVVPTDVSSFNNDAGYITETEVDDKLVGYATEDFVYSTIEWIQAPDWNDVQNKPKFAKVATSGSYTDLSNKPSIPVVSAQQALTTGVTVGSVSIDGVTTTFYAPTWSNMTGKPAIATSSGTNSIIEGLLPGGEYQNVASGAYAHAEGYRTIAGGNYSHAEGYGTNASSYQHVQGKHNVGGLIYADIIGNGSDENNESNAEATDWYGNKYLAGCIYFNVSDWNDPQNNSTKLATIPECPTDTDGTYTLQATVSDGEVTYSWVQQI